MADEIDLDLMPLFAETEETVSARIAADLNNGIDESSTDFTDDRTGSMFHIVSSPHESEEARLWDALANDVPSAAFPTRAWGDYLDEWCSAFGIERNSALKATGIAKFQGVAGTIIPAQTVISTIQTDPNVEPPEFVVTGSGGVIPAAISTPSGEASVASSGGALAANTYRYMVSAINESGETLPSAETSATTSGGNLTITVTWTAVPGATAYKVYRSLATGSAAKRYLATVVSPIYIDAGQDTTTTDLVAAANTTEGTTYLPIEALEAGVAGNVGSDAITFMISAINGVESVTNPDPTQNGADIESDEQLRKKLLLEFRGKGSGNQAAYMAWCLAYPGVGIATIIPLIYGPGTVGCIIQSETGAPLGDDIVDGLQYLLDPLPGLGAGLAGIDHTVTVLTPATVTITPTAAITFDAGYSLDGTDGTVPLRTYIVAAIQQYIDQLEAGEDVVFDHVKSRIYAIDGVYKVTSMTINGGSADISITTTPPQVAVLGTPVLS